jgi:hypothetical protein
MDRKISREEAGVRQLSVYPTLSASLNARSIPMPAAPLSTLPGVHKVAILTALVVLAAAGLVCLPAQAHRDPCHSQHACPSDHHSYVSNGLSCTSYPDERTAADTTQVVVLGRTYWCAGSAGSSPAPLTPTTTPAAPATTTSPAAPGAGHGTVLLSAKTKDSDCARGVLPDRLCSPGAYDPFVTQATIGSTICVSGYTKTVRNVSSSTKDAVYREYGIFQHAPYSYEIDHIISLELGGSNDIANLYPEAYGGRNGARVKDAFENELKGKICAGELKLRLAQRMIAGNWLAAARKYGLAK